MSGALSFIQSKNVFTGENTPDLESCIQKLIVDLFPLNVEKQNQQWSSLNAKYLPQEAPIKNVQLRKTGHGANASGIREMDQLPNPSVKNIVPDDSDNKIYLEVIIYV